MRGDRPLLIVILIIAACLRLTDLDLGWFMVDQARDAAAALKIAEGATFPIVGPVARGLYALGPLYYYLIAIPFLFSKQPAAAVFLIGLLNCVSVYLAYRLGREFFSPTVGLVGAALYAVFPMAIVSSHAMWNPAFIPFFAMIVLYALFYFIVAGRPWGLTVTLVALGCLLQIHPSALALVLLFLVVLALFRPPLHRVRGHQRLSGHPGRGAVLGKRASPPDEGVMGSSRLESASRSVHDSGPDVAGIRGRDDAVRAEARPAL
jgi:4-amino-4-deoxy-L-arabinose transferase-like glycosyltransferase